MRALYDVAAPAKLNLFLHITGQRDDGYHLIQSVFVPIDWYDTLHFEVRHDGAISREDLGAALPLDDLCTRAARALQEATNCRMGVHIAIDKSIPSQAGMGGGSSDAASTLLALNRLWGLNTDEAFLQRIAVRLGADVPFFLLGGPAWVEGIGEQLTRIEVPQAQFLVIKPDAGLDTALIFSDAALNRATAPAIIAGFAENAFGFGHNDLQPVAQRLCPGVSDALQWLSAQGLRGRMTGSGSAVFAHVPGEMGVNGLWPQAPSSGQARLCRSLQAHPLSGWAGNGQR